MQRTRVNSSNIASVGYDSASQTLEIEFTDDSIYQYYRVPTRVYQGLMNASSHGGYLDDHVKKPGYHCRKIH